MDNSSTLTELEKKSNSLFMTEQRAKKKLSIGVQDQTAKLPDYKQDEILSSFKHDLENDNLHAFAKRIKEAIATETDIVNRYDENDSPYFHIITHIKDYLLEQGFIHAQVREIQQELILFLTKFYDTSQKTTQKVFQMDESLKELAKRVGSVEVLVSGFQAQLQGNEERIANQVRGSLTQDLQGIATLEGRISENFAETLQTNIARDVELSLSNKFLNKGLFLTVVSIITGLIGVSVGAISFSIYARLGTLETNYSTLNGNINGLNGRLDTLQNNLNGRLDTLQNLILNQQTVNSTTSPPVPQEPSP